MLPDTAIFVVDDNEEVCRSMQWLLEPLGEPVATFTHPGEFLSKFKPHMTGCVVLDMHMPEMTGIEVQRRLLAMGAHIHIIFLTGHATVPTAVEAMRAGADDYFEKPMDDRRLVARVAEIMQRVRQTAAEQALQRTVATRLASLTPREREVLDMVVAGKRTKVIAAELGLSTKTVDAHRANILSKMQAHAISELVAILVGIKSSLPSPQ